MVLAVSVIVVPVEVGGPRGTGNAKCYRTPSSYASKIPHGNSDRVKKLPKLQRNRVIHGTMPRLPY
jgi:hypothetical protein